MPQRIAGHGPKQLLDLSACISEIPISSFLRGFPEDLLSRLSPEAVEQVLQGAQGCLPLGPTYKQDWLLPWLCWGLCGAQVVQRAPPSPTCLACPSGLVDKGI